MYLKLRRTSAVSPPTTPTRFETRWILNRRLAPPWRTPTKTYEPDWKSPSAAWRIYAASSGDLGQVRAFALSAIFVFVVFTVCVYIY